MNITFLDTKTVGNLPNLNIFEEFGRYTSYETTQPDEVKKRLAGQDIIITNKVKIPREVMEQSPDMKLICVAATGTNNVDLEAAKELNIAVKNVEDYSTASVAQHTFSMILSLLNQPTLHDEYVKSGAYSKSDIFTYLGFPFWELQGKRLGIIGLGNIGKKVAEIAEAFDCEIVYYSSSGKNRHSTYQRLEIEDLMTSADIISVHAPLNDATRDLINYEKLKMMKKDAILINTGRGGIINEVDLCKALDQNLIRGAAMDVFTQEPIAREHPFVKLKHPHKILLTPHIAWASVESRTLLLNKVYQNIKAFLLDQH
ncbi:lactate dehydrogenase-like 2-hydroxyacid dehydrogenase [Catalinimonas alkaloidigena]|uniref:D-2-hydroxyacid dehydrogenase n=1 Tax=Catalinimonas alkaloidigena TaxID=1075417 RepID=UPI00240610D4|nr:D-2-hydroxyacid dehydrogenase [Catalinimonas alkaloidigena]MDF9797218.1 lactate dehydrogenase-like 2-hydroxyacid dehydrogenase [Catalinimonas alkaloidigena]